MISRIAAECAGLSAVKRMIFCIGSLIPDLSPMQFIRRHFYKHSGEYVFDTLEKLSGEQSASAMLEYGKMAHYVSDFCCSVHHSGGIGDVNEHLVYERRLNRYMIEKYSALNSEHKANSRGESLKNVLEGYFLTVKFDLHTDLMYAVRACSAICEMASCTHKIKLFRPKMPVAVGSMGIRKKGSCTL
jgi:hypothetical protein